MAQIVENVGIARLDALNGHTQLVSVAQTRYWLNSTCFGGSQVQVVDIAEYGAKRSRHYICGQTVHHRVGSTVRGISHLLHLRHRVGSRSSIIGTAAARHHATSQRGNEYVNE